MHMGVLSDEQLKGVVRIQGSYTILIGEGEKGKSLHKRAVGERAFMEDEWLFWKDKWALRWIDGRSWITCLDVVSASWVLVSKKIGVVPMEGIYWIILGVCI